jgi:peptidyl-prolyl cis-trans isomerase D
MLLKIREKVQGIIAVTILVFMASLFVLWGIDVNSYIDGSNGPVAKVNGVKITQQEYRQALENVQQGDPRRTEAAGVKQMIVNNLIDQTLLIDEANDRGYRLSGGQLEQMIKDIPFFQRDGQYEPALYDAFLRRQNMRPGEFRQRLRENNITSQVQSGLAESVFVTDADVNAFVRLLQQQRRVSYAVVGLDTFLPKVNITAQDVEKYYEDNQETFRTPETVRIEYIVLSANDIAKQSAPTDADLREAYEAEAGRYATPAKRRLSHILVNVAPDAKDDALQAAKKRAEDLAKQAKAGGSFAALAQKNSDDKDSGAKGGDLGEVTPGLLPPSIESAAQDLKLGEVAGPVRTQFGFHIVKLTGYTPGTSRSFEAVKRELAEQVKKRKGEERYYEVGEQLRNLVYEHPEGLATAAKELGLKIQTSDWFTQTGGNGIAANPRVATAAFEPEVLAQERNSDVIELDPVTVAALHVIERKPSAIRPLNDVRAGIERTLKEQRAKELARAEAEEWTKKLSGSPAAEFGGALKAQTKTVTRQAFAGIDPRLAEAIFAAPRPQQNKPTYGHVDLGQGYAVYALESVTDVDPAKADADLKQRVRRELAQRRGAGYYSIYKDGLRRDADISINKDLL